MHKGKDNVYVFSWKGNKITLVFSTMETTKLATPTLLILPEQSFERHLKAQSEVILLLAKDSKETISEIPPQVQDIL